MLPRLMDRDAGHANRERPTRQGLLRACTVAYWRSVSAPASISTTIRLTSRNLVVEPSKSAMRLAQPREAVASAPVERIGRDGARIALPDGSVDCVLSTYTLCTIPAVDAALAEIHRVLKPEVRCISSSMGGADISPYAVGSAGCIPYTRIAGGCHMDRPIDDLITHAGLMIRELETGYGDGPRPFSYLYQGRALRTA